MNRKEVELLRNDGFSGFKTVAELRGNIINIVPAYGGVYVLLRPSDNEPVFLKRGTGGFFKGTDPNVELSKLEANWVDGTSIVYIGKADGSARRGLRKRLDEYMRFGQGVAIGHKGGRYVWQLEDAAELVVCWKRVNENPESVEKQMILAFQAEHGKYPFANLRL